MRQIFMEKATKPYGKGKNKRIYYNHGWEGSMLQSAQFSPKFTYEFNMISIKSLLSFAKNLTRIC